MQESFKLSNLGVSEISKGNFEIGLEYLKKAFLLDKNNLQIKNNFLLATKKAANFYLNRQNPELFLETYQQVIDLGIADESILKDFISAKTHFCDWFDLEKYKSTDPYENILRFPDEKENFEKAKNYSKKFDNKFLFKKHKNKKIKIGYVSNGFRDFPTGYNLISVLENHNKKKFDVYCYSYGEDDGREIKKRFEIASQFFDISKLNNFDAAKKIALDQIDILVDLKGLTDNNRLEILSYKPAPIQVNYLGYPGTTGAKFIDYIIADKTVIPPSSQKYYSETVIYLEGCYRPICCHCEEPKRGSNLSPRSPRHARDDKSVIFASFNMSYKITPEVFDSWIEILKSVPSAVLWLHKSNNFFAKNLNKYASKKGLDTRRILYQEDLPHDRHLDRLSSVDITLDTFPTNGHSTTVDSLVSGVPVVTLKGKHFTSRVSESVLNTFGLNILVAKNLDEYKKIAIDLAHSEKDLKAIKQKIHKKLSSDFSDIKKYTSMLENAYLEFYERHLKNS